MSFEKHTNPRASKLENFREEITEMRAQEWPFSRIQAYLKEQHSITAGINTIRMYCLHRDIQKGSSATPPAAVKTTTPPPSKPTAGQGTSAPATDDELYDSLVPVLPKPAASQSPFSPIITKRPNA